MRKIAFAGITIVAVVALALTAASVETLTVGIDPSVEGTATPGGGSSGGCGTNVSGDQGAACGGGDGGGRTDGQELPDTGESSSPADDGPDLWTVIASLTLLTVGGVVVVYGLTRGDGGVSVPDSEGETVNATTEPTAPVRLSADAPPTNDIYRTWLALRAAADSDEAVSPAAVAEAAIATGFDESAVQSLTREFCAVRYGRQDATSEREARARNLGVTLGLREEDD